MKQLISRKYGLIFISLVALTAILVTGVGCSSDSPVETETETKEASEQEAEPGTTPRTDTKNIEGNLSLTVTVSPAGGGTVDPDQGNFAEGSRVTLTSNPSTGYTFSRWGGDIVGSSRTVSFSMDSEKNIVAYFTSASGERTIQRITVAPPSINLSVNGRQQFRATATNADGTSATITSAARWRSSNPSVVTVSSSGVAVALSPGTASITATLDNVRGQAGIVKR